MKKKILFTIISTMLIFSATGCKRRIYLKNQDPTIEDYTKIGKFIKNTDLSFNDTTYRTMMDEALSDIKGATSYEDIYNATIKVFNKASELVKKYYVAEALYYADPDNEEYEKTRDFFQDIYLDYETFRANLIYEMSSDKDILEQFFAGYSKEDIDFEVELAKKKKDDKYKQIKEELDEIETEYNKLDSSSTDATEKNKILDLLYRFVNKNKELAEFLEFESYPYYKDISYKRIYTQTDTENFIKYAKEYILPLINEDGNTFDIRKYTSTLSYPEYSFIVEFEQSSALDSDYKTLNLAKDYAKNMGGDYYKTFNTFLNKGHYIFANNDSSFEYGFTNPYLSYFGPNNQNVSTIIHEFGHYYSLTNAYTESKSLDLQEFYSQANEFLFMSYLEDNSYSNVKKVFNLETKLKISNACRVILIGSAFREFENKLYSTTLTSASDILDIWNDLRTNEYNNLIGDYWKLEIGYDLYNISYATSITGALSLYDYSKTNYTDAKLKYMSACYNQNMDDDIEEIFEKCGLNSPFSEEIFLKIKKLVEEKGK